MNNNNEKKPVALTITYLSKVSFASLNGSDSEADNINNIKKITLENNEELPYVSAQAIRRALRDQLETMGWKMSLVTTGDGKHPPSTECDPAKYIDDDLFGFLNAQKESIKRTSPLRVEALCALSSYKGDLDFGTNLMGIKGGANPNIFETEIHSGIYRGTILLELDRVGCGDGFISKEKNNELNNDEKIERVSAFIDSFQNLWSSGRQTRFLSDVSPKFIAAAIMYSKNPIFAEAVSYPIDMSLINTVKHDYNSFIKDSVFAVQKSVFGELEDSENLADGFLKIKGWLKELYKDE
jgi:CRISPR-associated protein Cst2